MSYVKSRLIYIIECSSLTTLRLNLAVASILWGLLLFWPGETFSRPTYSLMGKFASEHIWAALFLLQGLVALYSVIYRVKSKIMLMSDGILGCILWTGSCIAMLLSVYPPPAAISAEITAAITSWWILIRYPYDVAGGKDGH